MELRLPRDFERMACYSVFRDRPTAPEVAVAASRFGASTLASARRQEENSRDEFGTPSPRSPADRVPRGTIEDERRGLERLRRRCHSLGARLGLAGDEGALAPLSWGRTRRSSDPRRESPEPRVRISCLRGRRFRHAAVRWASLPRVRRPAHLRGPGLSPGVEQLDSLFREPLAGAPDGTEATREGRI